MASSDRNDINQEMDVSWTLIKTSEEARGEAAETINLKQFKE